MSCVLYNKEQIALASYMIKYFKQRPPDCVLFSEDNSKILIHKELMYQTQYIHAFNDKKCCYWMLLFTN